MYEEVIRSDIVFSGKLIKVRIDEVKLPSGKIAKREIVVHRGGVAIVGFDENKVLLIRQYRHAAGKILWEIPAGTLEEGEDPLECAKRELLEETGYTASNFKKISQFYVAVGYCTEIIHLFIANGLKKISASPKEDEQIEVYMIPMDELVKMIYDGKIEDAKTIIGILLLKDMMEK
ncbi:MAG: NUDIX hydrolase [Candidatus Methanomethyliaceae archaeon]|nr:NUDIX hydrolase [Candidatus Methanomethyliaceae archaeon]MDW7970722.1 NUDIX hydrolase [Nitrososphaerota archaeon]